MDSKELIHFRNKLNKTQEEIACLLGVSVRAVRSYEQGWRIVPVHVERQVLFLVTKKKRNTKMLQPCWRVKKCPAERKKKKGFKSYTKKTTVKIY